MIKIRFHQDESCENPAEYEVGWTFTEWPRRHYTRPDPPDIGMRRKLATGCAWLVMGEPGYHYSSHDLRDWDHARGLMTVNHGEIGAKDLPGREADVDSVLQTWNDWAQGDCYGYTVESTTDGSMIDSCWGYVGEREWPYMADQVVAAMLHAYGTIPALDFGGDDNWYCEREVLAAIRRHAELAKAA